MPGLVLLAVGAGAIFAAAVLALGTIGVFTRERRAVERSLGAVKTLRLSGVAEPAPPAPFLERVVEPLYTRMAAVGRRLTPTGFTEKVQRRLDLAGHTGSWTVERVLAFKAMGLLGLGALGLVVGHHGGAARALLFAAIGAAAGFWLPDVLLYNIGIKRQQKIGNSLADALDLLMVSVEAGLAFDAALAQVARNTEGPLAGEFFRVLQEMQIGKSRTEAFRDLAARSSVPELGTFVTSLVQADAFGIPVANVLREQAKEMRLKRRQKAEEAAAKVPVKILFPLVAFILPALFVVVIGPGAISIMHSFSGLATP